MARIEKRKEVHSGLRYALLLLLYTSTPRPATLVLARIGCRRQRGGVRRRAAAAAASRVRGEGGGVAPIFPGVAYSGRAAAVCFCVPFFCPFHDQKSQLYIVSSHASPMATFVFPA